jgi:hypothetical protein
MSNKPLKISEQAAVQMPMKTVASLIMLVGEAELFMLVEHLSGVVEDLETELKNMRNNAVNIEFLKSRTEKLTEDVEKLIRNGSGH